MTDEMPPAWQRPPFEPGNTLAMKAGARSTRAIAPRAQTILDELLADESLPPYLLDASYRGALAGLARAEAVVSMLEDYLATLATEKAMSGALPILEQYRRWLATAQSHRRSLGLDPMSRGALAKDLSTVRANAADTLRSHASEGARVLASRPKPDGAA